jgi:hypothetical protein
MFTRPSEVFQHPASQSKSVRRPRHVDVSEENHHLGLTFETFKRFRGIGGFQDPVTALSEYIASDHADDIFVVDDQDCNGLSAFHRYPTRGAQARSHLMHCPA